MFAIAESSILASLFLLFDPVEDKKRPIVYRSSYCPGLALYCFKNSDWKFPSMNYILVVTKLFTGPPLINQSKVTAQG